MTDTLASLSRRTGMTVLDHLEQSASIPVIDGFQAQGDLIVIPLSLPVEDYPSLPAMPPAAGRVGSDVFAAAVAQVATGGHGVFRPIWPD